MITMDFRALYSRACVRIGEREDKACIYEGQEGIGIKTGENLEI